MSTYATNIPGASGYAGAALLATNAYDKALVRLNQKRMGTLRNYGYTADVDGGTGVLNNLRVDPSNPYGQYQSLLRSGATDAEQAQGDAQSRGLHGGLAHQLEDNARYTFGANSAQLGMNLNNDLTGYQDEQTNAGFERDNALWQAQHQADLEAAAAGAYNQGDYSGLDYGTYSDPPPPDQDPGPGPGPTNLPPVVGPNNSGLTSAQLNAYGTKAKVIKKITAAKNPVSDVLNSAKVAKKKKGGK